MPSRYRISGSAESGSSGDPLAELPRRVPATVDVNVGPQPVQQAGEAAIRESVHEPGHLLARGLEDLGAIEIAKGVGREVPHRPHRPVDVLQTTAPIVDDLQPEEVAVGVVPGGGKIPPEKGHRSASPAPTRSGS